MPEQRRAFESLDESGHPPEGRDVWIVHLGQVPAEDHLGVARHSSQDHLERGKLQVLRLVDDHELPGDGTAPQIGDGRHLQFTPVDQLLDRVTRTVCPGVREQGVKVVVHRSHPRGELLVEVAWQEADFLSTDGN
ncbi:MAG TPA: hypothetical protein VFL72_01135 [Acidimicrobiia bacterium]|nr:hypothetical protein [Acidimicrobiia bacterium]